MRPELLAFHGMWDPHIHLVTSCHEGRDGGMIATWITPASLSWDPYRVAAVISKHNATFALLSGSGRFSVHFLAEDQLEMVPRFGLHSGRDRDKFDGLDVARSPCGLPMVAGGRGWLECRVTGAQDIGDRVVFIGTVTAADLSHAERAPLSQRMAFARLPAEIGAALDVRFAADAARDHAQVQAFLAQSIGASLP